MIATEDEARALRCCGPDGCGSFLADEVERVTSAAQAAALQRYCIGSQCMAWRWESAEASPHVLRTVTVDEGEPAYDPKTEGVRPAWLATGRGYDHGTSQVVRLVGGCGLCVRR